MIAMAHRTFISAALLVLTFGLGVHALSQPGAEQPPPKADPERIRQLIDQLGDAKFSKRDQATAELEAIGPPALDLLRQAGRRPEVEVSRRADELVARIEHKLHTDGMLAPKKVRLNVKEVSVDEAVAELARLSGYPLRRTGDKPADRKVTLDTGEVTFWEALAQLCRAAELVENIPAPAVQRAAVNPAPVGGVAVVKIPIRAKNDPAVPNVVPLPQAPAQPAALVLADGKPQELLTVLNGSVRLRVLPPAAGAAPPAGETVVWLDVTAEPRLLDFGAIGAAQIDRAIDDQGQSLELVPAPVNPPNGIGNGIANGIANGNAIVIVNGRVIGPGGMPVAGPIPKQRQVPVRLKLGEKAARSLKELTGTLAVQSVKEAEPLLTVDNILKAAGQTVKGSDGRSLQVQAVEKLAEGGFKIQVVMDLPAGPNPNPLGNLAGNGGNIQVNGGNVRIVNGQPVGGNERAGPITFPQLVDAQGKAYPPAEIGKQKNDFTTGKTEAELIYRPEGEPARLVLYGQRFVTVAVPFTLKDVPLP
jgi:hypothetical protein